jgi:hypothetical protein
MGEGLYDKGKIRTHESKLLVKLQHEMTYLIQINSAFKIKQNLDNNKLVLFVMKVHNGGELFQNFLINFRVLLCIFYSLWLIVDCFAGAL